MRKIAKGILAYDPGCSGGLAVLHPEDENISLYPWRTEHEMLDVVRNLRPETYEAVIEDVPVFVSALTSNASSFKLGYNFGWFVGMVRALGFSTNLIKPKEWQAGLKGLKPKMGYTARKRMLKDNACRLYPDLKVTNATADAILIMDNWRNR